MDTFIAAIGGFLYKISFRFAFKVFFQNADDQKLFIRKNIVAQQATELIPGSGVDLWRFEPMAFKRNEKFTFLLISRLITDKLKQNGFDAHFQILGATDPLHKRGIQCIVLPSYREGTPRTVVHNYKQIASLDDKALEQFGCNGRLKMEKEYDESFVIKKYLRALEQLKKAS